MPHVGRQFVGSYQLRPRQKPEQEAQEEESQWQPVGLLDGVRQPWKHLIGLAGVVLLDTNWNNYTTISSQALINCPEMDPNPFCFTLNTCFK